MTRAALFAAIRPFAPGGKLTPGDVAVIDVLADKWGIARESGFDAALHVILKHEGGFVNHPRDPGGITMLGVTKATWEAWTGKTASVADMRALTPETVAPLYRKRYWEAAGCDRLASAGLALVVFDFAVNAGVSRAVGMLQRVAGVAEDGKIGPLTIAAANALPVERAIRQYSEARRAYYRGLHHFPTFGKGWLRRVDETEQEALA